MPTEYRNAYQATAITVDTADGPADLQTVLDGLGGPPAVAWDDITGKPVAFPTTAADVGDATAVGRSVLTAADATAARTAIGAGTSNLAIGSSGTTAAAGNHTHPGLTADQAAGTASVRTLGTGATQAAAGNHSHAGLMAGSAAAIADSTATDVAGLVADFNALLGALRTRAVITGP
ncbi:hypothetical protein ACQSSU_12830 [Micromonospora echinospora]